MKPEIAIGSSVRCHARDFTKRCERCGGTVYMRDQQAADAPKAICLPCFIVWLEEKPTDEKLLLMLPPGVTPRSFLAFLKGEIPSPFTS